MSSCLKKKNKIVIFKNYEFYCFSEMSVIEFRLGNYKKQFKEGAI